MFSETHCLAASSAASSSSLSEFHALGIARCVSGLLASVLLVVAIAGLDALLERWGPPLRVLYVMAVLPIALAGRHVALIQALLPLLRPRGIARRIPSPGSPPRQRRRCAISLASACPGPR